MKKRIWLVLIVVLAICAIGVGATYAYLASRSQTVINEFTAGDVSITLAETTGNSYKLIPGVTHEKDPVITVKAGSQTSWVFCRLEKSAEFSTYVSYAIADGWTPLTGSEDIYWVKVTQSNVDKQLPVLQDNKVTVHETLTEEQLLAVKQDPTLAVYAYAIQAQGLETAQAAWEMILQIQEG